MVEQLTLNQRVAGSSPARLTTHLLCIESVAIEHAVMIMQLRVLIEERIAFLRTYEQAVN